MTEPAMVPTSDGVVVLRDPRPGEADELIAGRDAEFHRWLGEGSANPRPVACIEAAGQLAGWVDYDSDRSWLRPGEVNVGYNVLPDHRGRGYATRAVQLLMHHLAVATRHHTATLLIAPDNRRSLAVAARARFRRCGAVDGSALFGRGVPPISYSDGTVTLRPPRLDDLDADLEAKDAEQMKWLWLPWQRRAWEAMSVTERRDHAARGLAERVESFGRGPKWTFSLDAPGAAYAAYVDCDLANEHVPAGEANISYSSHPAHRGRGYVTRGVRLATGFLRDHTGCREAHLVVDSENTASVRVARAAGATERECFTTDAGRTMIRHVIRL